MGLDTLRGCKLCAMHSRGEGFLFHHLAVCIRARSAQRIFLSNWQTDLEARHNRSSNTVVGYDHMQSSSSPAID